MNYALTLFSQGGECFSTSQFRQRRTLADSFARNRVKRFWATIMEIGRNQKVHPKSSYLVAVIGDIMEKYQCSLKWINELTDNIPAQIISSSLNAIDNSFKEFCMDCHLSQADNPYPFEQMNNLKLGILRELHINSHTIKYIEGMYEIHDEFNQLVKFRTTMEQIVIYSKYYAKCVYEKKDFYFFVLAELM